MSQDLGCLVISSWFCPILSLWFRIYYSMWGV